MTRTVAQEAKRHCQAHRPEYNHKSESKAGRKHGARKKYNFMTSLYHSGIK